MRVVIGPWTLDATDDKVKVLTPIMQTLANRLLLPDGSSRLLPATVTLRPRGEMPWARDPGTNGPNDPGVRAQGFYRSHRILLNAGMVPDLMRKTFAHEAMHQLEDDWLRRTNKRDIKPLFAPEPSGFPSEPYAVAASAALGGFTNPPYQTFYPTPKMPATNYAKLAAFSLRDDRPVDPCLDVKAQLAAAQAEITTLTTAVAVAEAALMAEETAHEATRAALADAETRLAACKEAAGKAAQA